MGSRQHSRKGLDLSVAPTSAASLPRVDSLRLTVNSQNLTLRLNGRILTSTVEVFKCRDARIVVGAQSSPAATDLEAAEPPQPLGTLQLDPPLDNVAIEYASPTHVGKIVIAPLPSEDALGRATFGFSQLSFRSASEAEPTVLFDERGALHFPGQSGERPVVISPGVGGFDVARQLVVSCGQDGRWQVTGLERGEKDYPVMA